MVKNYHSAMKAVFKSLAMLTLPKSKHSALRHLPVTRLREHNATNWEYGIQNPSFLRFLLSGGGEVLLLRPETVGNGGNIVSPV